MINVSNEFREVMKKRRDFKQYADITFRDGNVVHLGPGDFSVSNNSISDAAGANTLPLGVALAKSIQIEVINDKEQFADYDFFMAKIHLFLKLPLSNTTEIINKGNYTVISPETYGSTVLIEAVDDMYKANTDYETKLTFPLTIGEIYRDICIRKGFLIGSSSFLHDDYIVEKMPEGLTERQMLGYIAMIACGNARFDVDGYLQIKTYDFGAFEYPLLDIDGNNILDTEGEQIITVYGKKGNVHDLRSFNSTLKVDTDDIIITGVSTVINENTDESSVLMEGREGYVISVTNPLIGGNEEKVVSWIAERLIGVRFRKFSGEHISDPTIEFMDLACITSVRGNKTKTFWTVITDVIFNMLGYTSLSNSAESAVRNSSKYNSEATRAYVNARKDVESKISNYDTVVQQMTQLISQGFGMYITGVEQEDGSTIYYMHDKPTIEESSYTCYWTSNGIIASLDGGTTWAIDKNGNALYNILTARGVNADWINTGVFTVRDKEGNITFRADTQTGRVEISAYSFSLTGKSIEDISKEKADEAAEKALKDAKYYAEQQLADFSNVVAGNVENLQKQIDGQIETFYYDYEPTLSNLPASGWTSETERQKHEGDLFYWKSKGFSYRFYKEGSTWKWQLVQDTDITMALSQAAKAQDTADGKRRVFVSQPVPPYDIGDLWVQGTSGDIMRCGSARVSGSYVSSDWVKASKYTDDSALNAFVSGDYANTIQIIGNSIDKKAETWYQAADPSINWTGTKESVLLDMDGNTILDMDGNQITTIWEEEKYIHEGDLWHNTNDNTEWIYLSGIWHEMHVPDALFDVIDGKAQIFVSQPSTPYDVGDLWFNSTTSEIMTCINKRQTGSFLKADWQKRNKYTDDAYAKNVESALSALGEDLYTQMDGKIESYSQATDPSASWIQAVQKQEHTGDLWYNTSSKVTKRWSGNTWVELESAKANAAEAMAKEKKRVFISQPVPPYDIGDLWVQGTSGDIMRCGSARVSGSYVSSDWVKASKYTDDSAVKDLNTSLNSLEIFNRLTDNGKRKGIYMLENQLYINFDYARGGALKLGGLDNKNGVLNICDSDNNIIGVIDNRGISYGSNLQIGYYNEKVDGYKYPIITQSFTKPDGTVTACSIQQGVVAIYKETGAHFDWIDKRYIGATASDDCGALRLFNANTGDSVAWVTKGSIYTKGVIMCDGTKLRIANTDNYGKRKLFCYEMPSPIFGDIGEGKLDDNGCCYVYIDDIFSETINTVMEYQVFLQKEGPGDIWVDKKEPMYFVIRGTAGLKFAWEVKAKQAEFEYERIDAFDIESEMEQGTDELDYAYQASVMVADYYKKMEKIYDEEINQLYGTDNG